MKKNIILIILALIVSSCYGQETKKLRNEIVLEISNGASGAVPRPKGSADFQVLYLVSSTVEAPPAAKPLGRCVQAGDSAAVFEK